MFPVNPSCIAQRNNLWGHDIEPKKRKQASYKEDSGKLLRSRVFFGLVLRNKPGLHAEP